MEANGQHSKLIDEIPAPDIIVSMGCDAECPYLGRPFYDIGDCKTLQAVQMRCLKPLSMRLKQISSDLFYKAKLPITRLNFGGEESLFL